MINLMFLCVIALAIGLSTSKEDDYMQFMDSKNRKDFINPLDPLSGLLDEDKSSEIPIIKEYAHKLGDAPLLATSCEKVPCPPCPVTEYPVTEYPVIPTTNLSDAAPRAAIDAGIYFRRFVSAFMLRLERKLPAKLGDRQIALSALLLLGQSDINILQQFVKSNDDNYQDVTEVLSSVIRRLSHSDAAELESWDPDEIFGFNVMLVLKCACIVALVCVTTLAVSRICLTIRLSPMRAFTTLYISMLVISIPWEWQLLYKTAVAKRMAEVSMTRPADCQAPSELSLFSSLLFWADRLWRVPDDACVRYYAATVVDPVFDVSPLEALTTVTVKGFVKPTQYVAAGLATFFNEILKGSSVIWGTTIVVLVMIAFVLWLIMHSGYQIRVPFMFGLERAPAQNPVYINNALPRQNYIEDVPRRHARNRVRDDASEIDDEDSEYGGDNRARRRDPVVRRLTGKRTRAKDERQQQPDDSNTDAESDDTNSVDYRLAARSSKAENRPKDEELAQDDTTMKSHRVNTSEKGAGDCGLSPDWDDCSDLLSLGLVEDVGRCDAVTVSCSLSVNAAATVALNYPDNAASLTLTPVDVKGPLSRVTDPASVAGKSASVTGLSASVAGKSASVAGLSASVAGKSASVAGLSASVAGKSASVAGLSASVAGKSASVAGLSASVAGKSASVTGLSAGVADSSASVAGPSASVAGPSASVARPSASVAGPSASVADPSASVADPAAGLCSDSLND